METARVCAVEAGFFPPRSVSSNNLTDLFIGQGKIRQHKLLSACHTWTEVLRTCCY
jgi:hypothetical protein